MTIAPGPAPVPGRAWPGRAPALPHTLSAIMLVATPAAGANVMEMALWRRQVAEPMLKLPCTSSVVTVRFSGASSTTSCGERGCVAHQNNRNGAAGQE
jgi:hypothetical protein